MFFGLFSRVARGFCFSWSWGLDRYFGVVFCFCVVGGFVWVLVGCGWDFGKDLLGGYGGERFGVRATEGRRFLYFVFLRVLELVVV